MEYRACGHTGLKLSVLGCGCWAFGGGEYWGEQSQKDVDEVIARAIDLGITYFDTAEAYNDGASESSLGLALKGRRGKGIIGTKISPSNAYPDRMVEHCEASLRRLGTDYIDLYMIHWPIHPHAIRHFTDDESVINSPPRLADAMATMMKLRDAGKIRHVGVSNFAVPRLTEVQEHCSDLVADELPYSLLTRAIEYEVLPYCRRTGLGVIGYMTLLQGLLADIYPTLDDVQSWQRRTRHFDHRHSELCRHGEGGAENETNQAIADIRTIAREGGMTMPQIAVKWAVANPAISCALVGARNLQELEASVEAASSSLAPDLVKKLDAATKPLLDKLGPSFDYYESSANDRTR